MKTIARFANRAAAGIAASAMTAFLLVISFAVAPQTQAVTGVIA